MTVKIKIILEKEVSDEERAQIGQIERTRPSLVYPSGQGPEPLSCSMQK